MNQIPISAGGFPGWLDEYLMFFERIPLWGHAIIAVLALGFLLNAAVNIYSKVTASATHSTEQVGASIHEDASVAGDVDQRSTATGPISADRGGNIVLGDTNDESDHSTTVNIDKFVVQLSIDEPELAAQVYSAQVETDDGLLADVTVHILWRDASWHFGKLSFNKPKLTKYLRSPGYIADMKSADAIVCVGLSSNWADTEGTTSVSSLRKSTQQDVEEKSDNRAFSLCKAVSEQARTAGVRPQFLGLGLGFHVDQPATKDQELKQRALVMLHVKTESSKRLSVNELKGLLVTVMNADEILEFEGHRYSRVVDERPVCWTQTFHGTFLAGNLNC